MDPLISFAFVGLLDRWRLMAMPAERIDQPDFAVAWRDLARGETR